MSKMDYAKQKKSKYTLHQLFEKPNDVLIIHYSCESFYERKDATSPRITSIAVRSLESSLTESFSIHREAELRCVGLDDIAREYNDLELGMLESFYKYMEKMAGKIFLHWNMRDANYGFAAIEHRYKVLQAQLKKETALLVQMSDDKKIDLSRLLIDIYGLNYVSHPRLTNIMKMNSIEPKDFMTGQDEADAFDRGDYVALHLSTLRKVDVMANIAHRAHINGLKTNCNFWDKHGGYLRAPFVWMSESPMWVGFTTLVTALTGIHLLCSLMK